MSLTTLLPVGDAVHAALKHKRSDWPTTTHRHLQVRSRCCDNAARHTHTHTHTHKHTWVTSQCSGGVPLLYKGDGVRNKTTHAQDDACSDRSLAATSSQSRPRAWDFLITTYLAVILDARFLLGTHIVECKVTIDSRYNVMPLLHRLPKRIPTISMDTICQHTHTHTHTWELQ